MSLIIDTSISLNWCFEDETSPETEVILDQVGYEGAVVPALWHTEIANGMIQAELRNRTTVSQIVSKLDMLGALLIETDYETIPRAWRETLILARTHRLTVYDACYLELALRRGLPLATLDKELAVAGREVGVEVLG